jgi:hypothetical protein
MMSPVEGETLDEVGVPVPAAGGKLHSGAALGRYVVLETLGAGGIGVVYGAYVPELDRRGRNILERFSDTFMIYIADEPLLKALRPDHHSYFRKEWPR